MDPMKCGPLGGSVITVTVYTVSVEVVVGVEFNKNILR